MSLDPIALLDAGAALVISSSGGKDSQAMCYHLSKMHKERGWTGKIYVIHADVEGWEWEYAAPMAKRIADEIGAEFIVVKNEIETIDQRITRYTLTRPGTVPFPDVKNRWCTSDFKRAPIDKWVRNYFPKNAKVVMAMGMRAEESKHRAQMEPCTMRVKASSEQKNRQVLDWLPIQGWTVEQVWNEIGYTLPELEMLQNAAKEWRKADPTVPLSKMVSAMKFTAAPPYLLGNERFSCIECVFASKIDLLNGHTEHPEQTEKLIQIEDISGFTFRKDFSIKEIK